MTPPGGELDRPPEYAAGPGESLPRLVLFIFLASFAKLNAPLAL